MEHVGFFLLLWFIVGFVVALVVGKILREANTRDTKPSIAVGRPERRVQVRRARDRGVEVPWHQVDQRHGFGRRLEVRMSGLMSRHWKPFSVLTASLAIALLLVSAPAGARTWSEAGLEVDNYKAVRLRIENLSGSAKEFLTERRIRNYIELRLRSVGLTLDSGPDAYLYINVTVLPIEIGTRTTAVNYMVSLDFRRAFDFKAGGQTFRFVGPAWYAAPFLGVSTEANVAATVLKTLDSQVGEFLNEYLKTNQK